MHYWGFQETAAAGAVQGVNVVSGFIIYKRWKTGKKNQAPMEVVEVRREMKRGE